MYRPLKIVFAGTPAIAKATLAHILGSSFKVELVLTQPDRPAGRGKKVAPSEVKKLALEHNIEVFQPISFKQNPLAIAKIKALNPDILIVVAYGLILPQELLDIPKLGCVNIHVSLLPSHRGAAPIQRAILAGDTISGVTIMRMDAGLDSGNILMQSEVPIEAHETAGDLHDKLAQLGAKMIVEYLHNHAHIQAYPQAETGITYAHKIEKAEAKINWQEEASIIARKIRGFNPAPGCFTYLDGQLIKIWHAQPTLSNTKALPGSIISTDKQALLVACGNNTTLAIQELQEAGRTRQEVSQYLQGHPDLVGKTFLVE